MGEKTIKSGYQVIKEFVARMAEDPAVDKGSVGALDTLLASEGKISVTKLLRELERLRKE